MPHGRFFTTHRNIVPFAAVAAVAVVGVTIAAAAQAAPSRQYVWEPYRNSNGVGKQHGIRAYDAVRGAGAAVVKGAYAGQVSLRALPTRRDGARLLRVCDASADGQGVVARIRVPDGRVLTYSAPSEDAQHDCFERRLGYPITHFQIVVGTTRGPVMEPPVCRRNSC